MTDDRIPDEAVLAPQAPDSDRMLVARTEGDLAEAARALAMAI
mgnify:CR=1 FL=1